MRSVIITGVSGSGKSSAIKILEDLGFYCIDNLPVSLLSEFVFLAKRLQSELSRFAIVVDARDRDHIAQLPETIERIRKRGLTLEVLFMEASDELIIRRFNETRRRHPLSPSGPIQEGLSKERKLLQPLKDIADQILDTTNFKPKDLKKYMLERFSSSDTDHDLLVNLSSFGFKHGAPQNADMVLDVRFLPNPFFEHDLRDKSGLDQEVREYLLRKQDTMETIGEFDRLMKFLLPKFSAEGKSYIHVAVGCTGGVHRSVLVASELAKSIEAMGYKVHLSHRDVHL